MTNHIKTEITTKRGQAQREVLYVSSAGKDLCNLPKEVADEFATGITVARLGKMPPNAKPWKGNASGVFELLKDYRGDTYRAVYTVRFKKAIYVLHAFQKKSKEGRKTPEIDKNKVKTRLASAKEHYEKTFGKDEKRE